jgi:hypothetical protein
MIDRELAGFLEDGVGIHIGTRNEQFEPNGARAISAAVDPDGRHLELYISAVAASRVLPDLEANGLAAIVFARPIDERACQVKATYLGVRAIEAHERAAAARQWSAFLDNLEYIGIPRVSAATWITEPDLAIRLKVAAIFEQTPGPAAGKSLA